MWKKSISILKKLIFFCNAYKVYKYKLVAYKYLIILNRKLKLFDSSKIYCKKLLRYSWVYNSPDYEMECYE